MLIELDFGHDAYTELGFQSNLHLVLDTISTFPTVSIAFYQEHGPGGGNPCVCFNVPDTEVAKFKAHLIKLGYQGTALED